MIWKLTAAFSLSLLTASAIQAQTRQLDAHQHGHGALNIAFEGATVLMELEAPGADIVGFEHPAKTADDRAMIDAAIAQLAKPLELFGFPADAGCTVTAAKVALMGEHDEEHHEEGHKEGHKDDHDHKEDAHDHKDEHAKHDEDHGDGHAGEEGHTEFHAEYALTCADPSVIDIIEFAYFDRFPNAAELTIQLISDKGAKGFEVERDEPRLNLSGAI